MNCIRACMYSFALLALVVLAAAVRPAIAQEDQATHIMHRLIPAGDTCATCHQAVYDQWKASPHGANGVECTVCHGETTAKDFAGKPGLSTCETCHSEQVAQLKSDEYKKGWRCVTCHQAHTFVHHKKAAPEGQ